MAPTFPISEIFYSIQGEGAEAGTPMIFLRLAGCNVGKPYSTEQRDKQGLQIFQNKCTTYDGREFPCDTDYRIAMRKSAHEILTELNLPEYRGCKAVSITGGEPLIHEHLDVLAKLLKDEGFTLHLETSGTVPMLDRVKKTLKMFNYIVLSPKHNYIADYADIADEIRILVDDEFAWDKLPEEFTDNSTYLWVSPVNYLNSLSNSHVQKCIDLVKNHPEIRMSIQMHKIIGAR